MTKIAEIIQPGRNMLEPDQGRREIELSEVRQLVIMKRFTASRYTYGKCQKCGCAKDRLRYILVATYSSIVGYADLIVECPKCGHWLKWEAKGYAQKDWTPESSFYRERDSQRQKAYSWENEFFAGNDLDKPGTQDEAEALIRKVFAAYKLPEVALRFAASGKFSYARGYQLVQLTGQCGLKPWVVVHEAAHIITSFLISQKLVPAEPGHGPTWVCVYALLLEKFLGVDSAKMLQTASRSKVQWACVGQVERLLQDISK